MTTNTNKSVPMNMRAVFNLADHNFDFLANF